MSKYRILSWNVNGIRSIVKKGFLNWFMAEQPDILCLQETKAQSSQIPEDILNVEGYYKYVVAAEKKGYSGVATLSKYKPAKSQEGLGITRFDQEGRTLITDYGPFILFNVYFPNGKMSKERLTYKMDFYDAIFDYTYTLKKKGKKLIVCGDVNTAHKEIDLARPRENRKTSGFLPEERAWIDKFIAHGFIDTFRVFQNDGGHYTWWDYKSRARERNIGWRIDYFYITENLKRNLKTAFILNDVMGSDHCPIGIELII